MIDRQIKFDNDSNILRVKLRRADNGQGLTGLVFGSTGLIISTICDNEATATTYTAAGATIETITTLGTYAAPTATKCRFKEVDATNHPGTYEIHLADARFSVASSRVLRISIQGATNLLERELVIELVGYDPITGAVASVTGAVGSVTGLTSADIGTIKTKTDFLPSVVAGGAGGVFIAGANAATSITTALTADITGNLSGSVGSVTGPVTLAASQIAVKKNTALANFEFVMYDSADHVTPKTGLTVTATRSIDGAAFGACANAVSAVGSGVYKINLANTDTNGTVIMFMFTAAGADTAFLEVITQA